MTSSVDITIYQSELEHRTAKSRYLGTNRKNFVKQLTRIERRQARICRIRARIMQDRDSACESEQVPNTPQQHHHIGLGQNRWEHIGTFLCRHAGDPAVQVQVILVPMYLTH